MRSYALLYSLWLVFELAAGQDLHMDTPQNVTVCEPTRFQWSGGQPPYTLILTAGAIPGGPLLQEFDGLTGDHSIQTLNFTVETQFICNLNDSTGTTVHSDFAYLTGCPTISTGGSTSTGQAQPSSTPVNTVGAPIASQPPAQTSFTSASPQPSTSSSISSIISGLVHSSIATSATSSKSKPSSSILPSLQSSSVVLTQSSVLAVPSPKHGLTGGAIAGIVVGAVFAASVIIAVLWCLIRQRSRSRHSGRSRGIEGGPRISRQIRPFDVQAQDTGIYGDHNGLAVDRHRPSQGKDRSDYAYAEGSSTSSHRSVTPPPTDDLTTEIQQLVDNRASPMQILQFILQQVDPSPPESGRSDSSLPTYQATKSPYNLEKGTTARLEADTVTR